MGTDSGPGTMPIDRPAGLVRHAVYRGFADHGSPPSPAALATATALPLAEVMHALHRLHDRHALVLVPSGDAVRMAHPFSAAPMGHLVVAAGVSPATGYLGDRMWWGGCSWDSFGISAALAEPVAVRTRCPWCGMILEHTSSPTEPPALDAVVHLPWPARRWWDDVVATCTRIRTFCSAEHVALWTTTHGERDGASMPLDQLWGLAHLWYPDRLDPDWQPRSRPAAQGLLAAAGLTGEFWRLA